MTDSASPDQPPAWAKQLSDDIGYLTVRLGDIETQLRDINAQLQTIGDVDEFGNPN
ncbi:hypothetical protein [Blastococcus sp. SYSU D01042]